MKIDSCIIVKNEEKHIERLINQLLLFSHEVHITDTGSTDNTIKIIESFQEQYNNIFLHHFEWCMDFSKARNYSFYCYECTADYQFWCDADDELNDTLINTLKNLEGDADVYVVNYLYATDYLQFRMPLFKYSCKFEWHDPIHEYIIFEDYHKLDYSTFDNGSLIIHHYRPEDHPTRNLEIFMNMEKNNYEFSPRNRFYYGRELYHKDFKEYATYQFCKCIESEQTANIVDKINSCIHLFYINKDIGYEYFLKLFKKEILRKDLLAIVGDYFFENEKFLYAKFYYLMCINCPDPSNEVMFHYDRNCHVNALLQLNMLEFYHFDNIDKSLYYNAEVLKIDPNNKTAIDNIKILNNIKNNK